MANKIYYSKTGRTGNAASDLDSIDGATLVDGDWAFIVIGGITPEIYKLVEGSAGPAGSFPPATNPGTKKWELLPVGSSFATAAQELAGASAVVASSPSVSREMIINLKPVVVSAAVLSIVTKSASATPDATNPIKAMVPDGAGNTQRTRTAGAIVFTLSDATRWGLVSSATDKIKLHPYAVWDAAGSRLLFAISRFSGFHQVPTTTTITDEDCFIFEDSLNPAYTPVATDHCACIGDQWATYNTANAPDWTFLDATTAVEFSPQVIWNPKSDYGKSLNLATSYNFSTDLANTSMVNAVVKQSGRYLISVHTTLVEDYKNGLVKQEIKTGSATYGSAVSIKNSETAMAIYDAGTGRMASTAISTDGYVNAGNTIHQGIGFVASAGGTNTTIYGDNTLVGATSLTFTRID